MKRISVSLLLALLAALPAAAATSRGAIAVPSLFGSTNGLSISLLGTEVSLSFENVSGLNLLSLGLSVHLVNPYDPALRARLPAGTGLSALPVLLRIEPPAWGGLSFRGVSSFEIHTHLLPYVPTTPLRIFAAPLGGTFQDTTAAMGPGSYRARSTRGGFSEFLIVVDLRPVDQVIATKLAALENLLEGYEASIPGSIYDDLEARLVVIRDKVEDEELEDAIAEIDGFLDEVEDQSGGTGGIPDLWRAARDRHNVAGYLRSAAETLRFSVDLKDRLGL